MELAYNIVQDTNIKLLGVTVLTSLDNVDIQEMFLSSTLTTNKLVKNLARMAVDNHFYGVICAPSEVTLIKQYFPNLKTVTSSIQLTLNQTNQKRIATPLAAKRLGVDYLVVGRAIRMASDPFAVYQEILAIFTEGAEG
ncbi:orotidine 5'-phosphate decarboxylase / HUMPS family protein [Spiroplasma endosymbiont of Glossina fuscipes fuscipes]|uniref:orotidine 5'-phosphate decarboxylase / HUMPS family protein n=1 Tax=Spiroplasma endosymbiont of Glossina fuscipes fuscipes TaxID=2004463 RepID=UPI003C725F64